MPPAPESLSFAECVELAMTLMAETFERHQVPHALIGGIAVAFRANPRATTDVDFIVAADGLKMGRVVSDLVAAGFTPQEREVLKQWTEDRLAVMRFGQVRIDWLKPVLPIYQHVVDSAERLQAFGKPLSVASVEGLILCKLLANRSQDQADIVALVRTHPGEIDLELIEKEWATVGGPEASQLIALRSLVQNPDSAH